MESAVPHREHRSRSAWRATQSQVSSASHPVTVASTLTFAARTARCSLMKRRIRIHWSASLSASGPWVGVDAAHWPSPSKRSAFHAAGYATRCLLASFANSAARCGFLIAVARSSSARQSR